MIDFYGLKNCDTCRKARNWLDAKGIANVFHDIREAGLDEATVAGWAEQVGWEKLLNRKSTTWRNLPDCDKANVDEARAVALMVAEPALIKRPVMVAGGKVTSGFDADVQSLIEAGN
jgi:arsenate reductase